MSIWQQNVNKGRAGFRPATAAKLDSRDPLSKPGVFDGDLGSLTGTSTATPTGEALVPFLQGVNRDARDAFGAAQAAGGGIGGGGSGSGSGSGSGISRYAQQGAEGNMNFLQQMLASGRFNPQQRQYQRNTSLDDGLRGAVSADRSNASGAYNALDAFLNGRADTTAFDGIQRQGGQAGDAFNALLDMLGANERTARQGQSALSQFGRADADRSIASQQLGAQTAIDLREDGRRQSIDEQNFAATTQARDAKNQILMQIAQIAASVGMAPPDLASIGLG